MIHYLYPEIDPLSRQVLGAYEKISELVELPFSMLDIGCMCGFLKHYLDQRMEYSFRYYGVDRWPEAIQVAEEFHPYVHFNVDVLGNTGGEFDYVCVNNIQFQNISEVIRKASSIALRAVLFGMPKHCGGYYETAKELGFDAEEYDCGESTLVKVNVNGSADIRRTPDGGNELAT